MVTMVKYQDRMVAKEGFRAFVHHKDGHRRLVESWDDYQKHKNSGDWHDTAEEAKTNPEMKIEDSSIIVNDDIPVEHSMSDEMIDSLKEKSSSKNKKSKRDA